MIESLSLRGVAAGRIAFVVAVVVAYTYSLDLGALAEPDEPRYAEIAREMLERHDFVTPTLNFVKYFEKPPLTYWLTALVFTLTGLTDWSARVVPVASALATLALTWAIGARGYGRDVAWIGIAVLATSPLFFGLGQTLTLDMPLTLWLTAALTAFWAGYHSVEPRRLYYRIMQLLLALAVLTKGPVAVILIAGTIAGFLVLRRDWRAMPALFDPVGIAVFAVVALPWFVLVSFRNPEFVDFFIVDQHFKRFLTPDEHQQSLWFFLPVLVATFVPWSLALLTTRRWWEPARRVGSWSAATQFCVVWSVVVVGFFSLSGSKLVTYILPALPPLALLVARALRRTIDETEDLQRPLFWFFAVLGVATIVGGLGAAALNVHWRAIVLLPYLGVAGAVLIATSLWLSRDRTPARAVGGALWGMLFVLAVVIAGRDVTTSYRVIGETLHDRVAAEDTVLIYRNWVQGVPWYSHRRTVLVGARGELAFGSDQGDQRAFFWRNDQQLFDAWPGPTRIVMVINRTLLEEIRPHLQPAPIEVASEGKKVVVVNHPLPAMPALP